MKKICYLIPLLVMHFSSAQNILWEKSYGGKHADYLFDAIPTPDYGFILAGSSLSKKTGNKTEDNRGDLDYWVWKMDEKGELDWQKTLGGNGQDILRTVVLTFDGGYLLAGSSSSDFQKEKEGNYGDKKEANRGNSDYWIIKLNAKGGEEWQKTLGGKGQDDLTSVLRTKDGGFLLGGSSSSDKASPNLSKGEEIGGEKAMDSFGGMDYWVVKIDKSGKTEWQHTFGGSYNDELRSMALANDGGYILGGSSNSPESGNKTEKHFGQSDYWIIKLDKEGNEQWQKTIGGKGDDQLYAVQTTKDGNLLLAGNSNSETGEGKTRSNQNGTDFWVIKLKEEDKTVLWQETYDIAKADILTSIVENDDTTLLISGYAQGERIQSKVKSQKLKTATALGMPKNEEAYKLKKGTADYVLIKIKENGDEIWRKEVGSQGEDILKKTIETRDGGYLLAGSSKGKISNDRNSGIGGNDFWVVKLKDKDKKQEAKENIEAIPNPATDYTNVIVGYDYTKGKATLVDLAGHTLQEFEITDRTVPVDLQGLPEGIYIVNIKTDKGSGGVKVIKQRNK